MFTKISKPASQTQHVPLNNNLFIQPRLNVGKRGDKYEVEADNVADKLVNHTQNTNNSIDDSGFVFAMRHKGQTVQKKPLAETVTPPVQQQAEEKEIQPKRMGDIQKQEEEELESVQAQVEEEEEPIQAQVEEEEEPVQAQVEEEEEVVQQQVEEEEPIQMQEEEIVQPKVIQNTGDQSDLNVQSVTTPTAENRIKSSSGNGNKMDENIRAEMESGFGADFSRVKIHTDNEAVQMNKELRAQAFTHGNDIYFNKGKYNPGTKDGKHLLAHELTHTIQQNDRLVLKGETEGENMKTEGVHQLEKIFLYKCENKDFWLLFRTEKLEKWLLEYTSKTGLKFDIPDATLKIAEHMHLLDKLYGLPERAVLNETYNYSVSVIFQSNHISTISLKLISPSLPRVSETKLSSEKEETVEEEISEDFLNNLNDSDKILNQLDDWLSTAEFVTNKKVAKKINELRKKLQTISKPLTQALDIKRKSRKIAVLLIEIQMGAQTSPGSEKGVEAAARIFKAMSELGQEIPILGNIVGSYLEFLKLPVNMIEFGKKVRELRTPEKREKGLREVPS